MRFKPSLTAVEKGQSAKLVARAEQGSQTSGVWPGAAKKMVSAAVRAAATSGIGVGGGVPLGVAGVVVAPQPAKGTAAAATSMAPRKLGVRSMRSGRGMRSGEGRGG